MVPRESLGRLLKVDVAHDRIAPIGRLGPVACLLHGNRARHIAPLEIPNGGGREIVDQPPQRGRPWTMTARSPRRAKAAALAVMGHAGVAELDLRARSLSRALIHEALRSLRPE